MSTASTLGESRRDQRTLALVNPNAGTQFAYSFWLRHLLTLGGRFCTLECDDDIASAREIARREGFDRLIIVGGDGTISRILNFLDKEAGDFDIAVVPSGTGNDFARSLGVSISDPEAAWNLALDGVPSAVDWVALRGAGAGHFINGISAGFGGRQAADVDPQQKLSWGRLSYWFSALGQMGDMPEFDVVVQTDSEEHAERCLGFWVMNGRTVGGGFTIAPTALLDDGLMDIVLIPALPMLELLATGVDFSVLGPEKAEQVFHLRVPRATVIVRPSIPLSLDGDLEEANTIELEVRYRALRFISEPLQPAQATPD